MTKRTLLKKLIALYIKVGEEITEENWWSAIYDGDVKYGICHAAGRFNQFGIGDWVDYWKLFKQHDEDFWIKPLWECKSFPEALANIETRIELMTHELCSGIKD